MLSQLGNQHAKKLKTIEIKMKVYKDYCDHIAEGWPKKAWYYEKDGLTICYKTMENYLKTDNDFPSSHKTIAEAKALRKYIEWGRAMMLGQVEKSQPALFQILMRNMFGWDRDKENKTESKGMFNQWYDKEIKKKKEKVA